MLDAFLQVFKQGLFANPHSQNSGFIDASDIEEKARQLTLSYLKASATEYECIFTSGATGKTLLLQELLELRIRFGLERKIPHIFCQAYVLVLE